MANILENLLHALPVLSLSIYNNSDATDSVPVLWCERRSWIKLVAFPDLLALCVTSAVHGRQSPGEPYCCLILTRRDWDLISLYIT